MSFLSSPQEAADLLKRGELVGLPTETVYGLGAAFDNPRAIEKIFELKKRPKSDPLIVHVLDAQEAFLLCQEFDELIASRLIEEFWPGPLTLVLPKESFVSDLITAGKPSLAVRSPRHPSFREVLSILGKPICAPSANPFGRTSPSTSQQVANYFPGLPILDGGDCDYGIESTVVQIRGSKLSILRPGSITQEALESSGFEIEDSDEIELSPGHQKTHYQPAKPLVILQKQPSLTDIEEIEKCLGLQNARAAELVLNKDPKISAQRLYQDMTELSQSAAEFIFVVRKKSQEKGLWTAIWNRLEKAASLEL